MKLQFGIFLDQAPLPLQPFIQRRPGDRLQDPDHRQGDAVVLDEAELILKYLLVVAVETHNESRR